MDRPQDLDGALRVGDRRVEERFLVGAALALASRGPAFQVLGTTHW